MKRLAILQSNYIPWRGYFDLIDSVDEFVLYDDVQYTRCDWRNRNRIKTPQGTQWLTLPVLCGGRRDQTIRDALTDGTAWAARHWRTLTLNYAQAPHFKDEAAWIEPLYQDLPPHLSQVNHRFLAAVCRRLGIGTRLSWSWDYPVEGDRCERLARICVRAGANVYVTGPAARDYLDESVFARHGVAVQWFDYAGFPPYAQRWGGFDPAVTILDVLFNTGPAAASIALRRSMR